MNQKIVAIARISTMLKDKELAAVEQVLSQLNAIRRDGARLEAARSARMADGCIDAARLAGVDVMWLMQIEAELRRLRQREAMLRVAHEAALKKARRAFGRAEVAEKMARLKPPV